MSDEIIKIKDIDEIVGNLVGTTKPYKFWKYNTKFLNRPYKIVFGVMKDTNTEALKKYIDFVVSTIEEDVKKKYCRIK